MKHLLFSVCVMSAACSSAEPVWLAGGARTSLPTDRPLRAAFVVLDLPRDHHTAVVTARVQAMLDAGWIDEVRDLRERWSDEVRPFGSVGYREVLAHVRDGVTLEETQRLIRKSTRTYARRQRTWFKGEPGVNWFSESAHLNEQEGRERIARELGL